MNESVLVAGADLESARQAAMAHIARDIDAKPEAITNAVIVHLTEVQTLRALDANGQAQAFVVYSLAEIQMLVGGALEALNDDSSVVVADEGEEYAYPVELPQGYQHELNVLTEELARLERFDPDVLIADNDSELCNECERSVAPGSGRYVNRVADLNDEATRKEMGKPFPKGGYVCAECDNRDEAHEWGWPPLLVEHKGVKVYHCWHDDCITDYWFTTDPKHADIDAGGDAQFDVRDLPTPKQSWPHDKHQRIVEAIEAGLITEDGYSDPADLAEEKAAQRPSPTH